MRRWCSAKAFSLQTPGVKQMSLSLMYDGMKMEKSSPFHPPDGDVFLLVVQMIQDGDAGEVDQHEPSSSESDILFIVDHLTLRNVRASVPIPEWR